MQLGNNLLDGVLAVTTLDNFKARAVQAQGAFGHKQNALLVPRSAIVNASGGAGPLVLTIDDGGKVHKQAVTLGLQDDKFSEVVAGLDNGQLVATTSLNDLTEGEIVAPQVDTRTASVAR